MSDAAAVVEELAARLAARRWDDAAALYAVDAEVVNRFAPDGPTTSVGREPVRAYFAALGSLLDSLTMEDLVLTPGADPGVLTVEFSFVARAGGTTSEIPAVFVMRVRDGQIVSSRDHVGPRRER